MQTVFIAAAGVLLLAAAFSAAQSTVETALESLVKAERSFASLSAERGVQNAFLANLASDAVLFRPIPVPGLAWTKEYPLPDNIALSWKPTFADIAASGDMGYTTGPWELRKKGESAAGGVGQYITVWKQCDGVWKVAVDIGIIAPAPESDLKHVQTPSLPAIAVPIEESVLKDRRAELLAADSDVATAAAKDGLVQALVRSASDAVRFYRSGMHPVLSRRALSDVVEPAGFLRCDPVQASVAASGDFGYTYGIARYRADGAEDGIGSTGYLRVWKRESGVWKIALTVE